MNCKIADLSKIKEKYKFLFKPFLVLCFIYGVAITAIVRANFNYIDDLGRVAQGYRGWSNFSRYVSDYLSIFIHTAKKLTDISPLPQIIAVIFIALASIILIYALTNKKEISNWSIIAVLPLGLTPYFLECFSYKFDSPYMAFSVLASVFPLLFIEQKSVFYIMSIVISTLVMSMSYQASSGIFILAVIFLLIKKWNENELKNNEIFKIGIYSCAAYLSGLVIFKLFFMRSVDTYVSNSIGSGAQIIQTVPNNIFHYLQLLYYDSTRLWLILVGLLSLMFIINFVVNSKRQKYQALILSICVVVIGSIISYGAYIVLVKPLFAPRAMYGIGSFLALLGILSVNSVNGNIVCKAFTKLVCMGLSWALFVFAFTYGNALAEQKRYTEFRTQLVISDLTRCVKWNNNINYEIQLNGNAGKAPIVKNMEKKYGVLQRLVPVTLGGSWWWSEYYFFNYFNLPNVKQEFNNKVNYDKSDLPIIYDCVYHTIKAQNNKILINFK